MKSLSLRQNRSLVNTINILLDTLLLHSIFWEWNRLIFSRFPFRFLTRLEIDSHSDIARKYFPILDLAFLYCPIDRQPMGLFYALDQELQNGTLHFWTEVFDP